MRVRGRHLKQVQGALTACSSLTCKYETSPLFCRRQKVPSRRRHRPSCATVASFWYEQGGAGHRPQGFRPAVDDQHGAGRVQAPPEARRNTRHLAPRNPGPEEDTVSCFSRADYSTTRRTRDRARAGGRSARRGLVDRGDLRMRRVMGGRDTGRTGPRGLPGARPSTRLFPARRASPDVSPRVRHGPDRRRRLQ